MTREGVPDHVPDHLIFDFDYIAATSGHSEPHGGLFAIEDQAPPFFYTPHYGGHWVARSYHMVSELFRDYRNFGTYPSFIPSKTDMPRMIPVQDDPPDHGRFKRLMGSLTSPAAMRVIEDKVRAVAVRLIEPIATRESCDFVTDYAQLFPQQIFLSLMGLPMERAADFLAWAQRFLSTKEKAAAEKIVQYLKGFIEEKAQNPGDDWASFLVSATDGEGKPALTREEVLGISYLLFLGGLDTATNAHAHSWRYFAAHPDLQREMRDNPERIPDAMEEMLRVFAITNNSRKVRADMEFHGVALKAGESVMLLTANANRDGAQFDDPDDVRLDRDGNVHLTFGAGIHRCFGSNLARLELRVSMEEWQKRIPEFRLGDMSAVRSVGGTNMGLNSLPLVWSSRA